MFAYYYDDLKEASLFNSPYKIHMKGFIDLSRNDFIYILYSHGQLFAIKPDDKFGKLTVYTGRKEVEELIEEKPFLTCYDFEGEVIIDHNSETFNSNLFKIEKVGNPPFEDDFFIASSQMEIMVMNEVTTNTNKFIDKILSLEPKKESSIDELIMSVSKIKKTKIEIDKNLKEINEIIDKDYR